MHTGSARWLALLGLVVALFAATFLAGPLFQFGVGAPFVGLVVVALALAALAMRRRSAPEADGASVWDAIPSWQYDGRHVESGGLTRDEQERALREVQEEAAKQWGEK